VCNGTTVTHAVQTIGCGYILQNNAYVPVYIIKNQWSQYWVGPRITSVPASTPSTPLLAPAAICFVCGLELSGIVACRGMGDTLMCSEQRSSTATAPLALERTRCHRVLLPSKVAGNPIGTCKCSL
jgi:hypothetical protein